MAEGDAEAALPDSGAACAAPKRGSITWAQRNLLFALCASVFLSGCLSARAPRVRLHFRVLTHTATHAASMLAPILPARLDELHSPAIMRGAIFGAYPATVAVVSLFVPQLIDRFGRKPLLVGGLAAEGALVCLFGAVRIDSPRGDVAMLWLYLFLRILTVSSTHAWAQPTLRTRSRLTPATRRASARRCKTRCCCCMRRTSLKSRAAWQP